MSKAKYFLSAIVTSAAAVGVLTVGAMAVGEMPTSLEYDIDRCTETMEYGNLNDFHDTFDSVIGSDFKIEGTNKSAIGTLTAKGGTIMNYKYASVRVMSGELGGKLEYGGDIGFSYTTTLNYKGRISKAQYIGTTYLSDNMYTPISEYWITAQTKQQN